MRSLDLWLMLKCLLMCLHERQLKEKVTPCWVAWQKVFSGLELFKALVPACDWKIVLHLELVTGEAKTSSVTHTPYSRQLSLAVVRSLTSVMTQNQADDDSG